MRFRSIVALLGATTLTLFGSSTASATTHPTKPDPVVTQNYVHINQAAVRSSVKAHGGVLTMAEANRLGLKPNTQYAGTAAATHLHQQLLKAETSSSPHSGVHGDVMRPNSSDGWNGSVYIELQGSGLHVSLWYTRANTTGCSYSAFWEDGDVIGTGPYLCSDSSHYIWESTSDNWFDDDTELCNTWVNIGGKPCEWVYS